MLKNILTSAVFAGIVAGFLAAIIHMWMVIPLVLEGELYESSTRVHFASDSSTQSEAGAPSIWDNPVRHLYSLGFAIVAYTGYAFLLIAGFALAERFGHIMSAKQGLIWGLGGFIAMQLAPAAGLPPELPGTVGPEVAARQIWWIMTVLCTAGALILIAFGPNAAALAGIGLIAVPHIIGAPHLDTYFGVAPPELSAHFVSSSMAASALAWGLLGFISAWFWTRAQEV